MLVLRIEFGATHIYSLSSFSTIPLRASLPRFPVSLLFAHPVILTRPKSRGVGVLGISSPKATHDHAHPACRLVMRAVCSESTRCRGKKIGDGERAHVEDSIRGRGVGRYTRKAVLFRSRVFLLLPKNISSSTYRMDVGGFVKLARRTSHIQRRNSGLGEFRNWGKGSLPICLCTPTLTPRSQVLYSFRQTPSSYRAVIAQLAPS